MWAMPKPVPPSSKAKFLFLLSALAVTSLVAGTMLGSSSLNYSLVFSPGTIDHHIFWNLRLPQALVAFLAGSGLAACGMVFQVLFLNPLATPFTLGVAGGASCGAALVIFLTGLPGLYVGPSVMLGAFAGSALAMALVLLFSRTKMGHQRHVMLLAGVAVSFFFSSLLLLIQALSSFYQSFQIIRWLMGGIKVAGYREVFLLIPVIVPGLLAILAYGPRLNLLLLGDELAQSRGLNVGNTKRVLFCVVSVMVATIVSVTGPIGFVGMVVPHICRLLISGNHAFLAPTSILLGGTAVVFCDLVSRLILPPSGIPVGVVTSLIGAPFFFYLLLHRRFRF